MGEDLLEREGRIRERAHGRQINGLEATAATAGELLEGFGIDAFDLGEPPGEKGRPIDKAEGLHAGEDLAIDELDRTLDEGLVAGVVGTGREADGAVVGSEASEERIRLGFEAVGVDDGALEAVGDEHTGYGAEGLEGAVGGVGEILLGLARDRKGEEGAAGSKDSHEDLFYIRMGVEILPMDFVAGEVEVEGVPGLVVEEGGGFWPLEGLLQDEAELAIGQTIGMIAAVVLVE